MSRSVSKPIRFSLAVAILSSCIGCDQATKWVAARTLQGAPTQSYFGDTIRLEYALNPGGFLSVGSSLPPSVRFWLFIGFNLCFMLAVTGFLVAKWNVSFMAFVSLAYVLAGGVGNLINRITQNGLVTDFVNVGIGPIRSGVFNVADVAVMFGGIALIIFMRRDDVRAS